MQPKLRLEWHMSSIEAVLKCMIEEERRQQNKSERRLGSYKMQEKTAWYWPTTPSPMIRDKKEKWYVKKNNQS